MADFKRDKFRTADDSSYILRTDAAASGVPVLFRVSGVTLSTLASEGKFPNFDAESDKILETIKVSAATAGVYFEWVGDEFHRM